MVPEVLTSHSSLTGRGTTGGVKDHSKYHSIDLVRCHKTIENPKRIPVPIVPIIPKVATSYCSLAGREATGGVKDHSKYHSIDLARGVPLFKYPRMKISQNMSKKVPRREAFEAPEAPSEASSEAP